jgi:hypothetical protein
MKRYGPPLFMPSPASTEVAPIHYVAELILAGERGR